MQVRSHQPPAASMGVGLDEILFSEILIDVYGAQRGTFERSCLCVCLFKTLVTSTTYLFVSVPPKY